MVRKMDFGHREAVHIRRAIGVDLGDIVRMWKRNIKTANTASDIADIFHSFERYFFVATSRDKVIGFVGGAIRREHGHISGIAVDKGYRRKGIGTRLLRTAHHEFLAKGFDKVTLEVRENNSSAIQFYKKEGYRWSYVIKGYYADGEDAFVYEKQI
jgi:ribosomal-protein-alanine acetyltransferase